MLCLSIYQLASQVRRTSCRTSTGFPPELRAPSAIGAKGLLYFCWWTPDGADFLRGQAIMTPDCSGVKVGEKCDISNQVPSQKFAAVQRINAKLSVLGGYLLERRSSAVLQVVGNRTHSVPIEGHRNLTSINVRHVIVLTTHSFWWMRQKPSFSGS